MNIVSFVKFGLPLAQHLDSHEFSEQKIKIVTPDISEKEKKNDMELRFDQDLHKSR